MKLFNTVIDFRKGFFFHDEAVYYTLYYILNIEDKLFFYFIETFLNWIHQPNRQPKWQLSFSGN